jgi:hypothetical protein
MALDLVIRGGRVATAAKTLDCDVGILCADDFYSATVSAAYGGTTTIVPFCAQHRGDRLEHPLVQGLHDLRAAEAIQHIVALAELVDCAPDPPWQGI